jgi:asparagine synthase (glutamine-hydrolysing)
MSGLVGCFNLNEQPASAPLIKRMLERIAHRGPDRSGSWINGPVGMGHVMLHTTPESLHERQPLLDETGMLCLTLDGRVDNREELRDALLAHGLTLRTDTDAELVLRAYQCWRDACPVRILGDFAFVIWDRHARRLFCARDILGLKPLYYYTNRRVFLWVSELSALFEEPAVPRAPNEGMIGDYLASALTNNEETLWQGITRLPPAHALVVEPGRMQMRRYWDIDPGRAIRYRNDDDYAEHFHAVFREAVRCRLRSHGPVAADLSGGLDSSSVVGMAQALFREGRVPAQGFETFALSFPGLPCDEQSYIDAVSRQWNLKTNTVVATERDSSYYRQRVEQNRDFPPFPNSAMFIPLRQLTRKKNIRVVLDGSGGDEWLTGSFYHYADLLRGLQLPALVQQVRSDSRVQSVIFPSWPLLRAGLWPLIPSGMRLAVRRLLQREGIPHWITPEFSQKIRLRERLACEPVNRHCLSFAQEDMHHMLLSGLLIQNNEANEQSNAQLAVEVRAPFFDRRLVELAFALPEDQRWRNDQPKYVLRRAMRELLPDLIRTRATKADFSHVFAQALQADDVRRIFARLMTEELGWVHGDRVRAMYRRMIDFYACGDNRYIQNTWSLWMIYGIELWLKTIVLQKGVPVHETGCPIQA